MRSDRRARAPALKGTRPLETTAKYLNVTAQYLTGGSWNHITSWLRRVEVLREAA